jgi:cytochrome P450
MRLYPPAWVVGRRAIEDAPLRPWTVPKGAIVIMSQWITHRDPRFWPQPDAFRPERWSTGETDGLPKFAYFPFGGGAIGRRVTGLHAAVGARPCPGGRVLVYSLGYVPF